MEKMFSSSNVFSTTSVFSTYTAFMATAMLIRTVINEFQSMITQLLPDAFLERVYSKFQSWFFNYSSVETLVIDEHCNGGMSTNEIFEASQLYLQGKISPWNQRLNVKKFPSDKSISVTVNKGEEIVDFYQGIKLTWVIHAAESKDDHRGRPPPRSIEVSFPKNQRELILTSYVPHVLDRAKTIKEETRGIKLYSMGFDRYGYDDDYDDAVWASIDLKHPSTFGTLALDPAVKKGIIDDLDRFVSRRDYYKRVGKAWKRGYLLYGPPGTGKSSLIAAMANYLNFHIYDLELSTINKTGENLKSYLVSMANRSILVIEDIDCTIGLKNRETRDDHDINHDKVSLSGLLNFVDGLWSSCGDEKIIVFTTNYKDKLDPALLRPGRMDMHIHMSYLTPAAFEVLAHNYLGETDHVLIPRVKELVSQVEVTPAVVAEELMKTDDAKDALEGLIKFLEDKKLLTETPPILLPSSNKEESTSLAGEEVDSDTDEDDSAEETSTDAEETSTDAEEHL